MLKLCSSKSVSNIIRLEKILMKEIQQESHKEKSEQLSENRVRKGKALTVERKSKNFQHLKNHLLSSSAQFSSVTQLCLTLCDPMNCSTPGLPVHNKFPEFTQTHAHQVGDAIQPSHPLLSPSPPAPNPSKHQGLFQ